MTATAPFPIAGEDLIDRLVELRALGVRNVAAAADRLGVHKATLEKAIARARKANDPRVAEVPRQDVAFDDLNTSTMTTANVKTSKTQRRKAIRYTASAARDAADLAQLLDALGLAAEEGSSK